MSAQPIMKSSDTGFRGPVLVTGNAPFDGLGVVFGGAQQSKKPVRVKTPAKAGAKTRPSTLRIVAMTILTGALSGLMYGLLYSYQQELVQLADATRHGGKASFIIPIIIALVFSLVHGSFTERFWGMLGLKPKNH